MDSFLHQAESDDTDKNRGDIAGNLFLTNLISALPNLDALQSKNTRNDNSMNGNSLFSSILDPYNGRGANNVLQFGNYNMDPSNPIDIFANSASAQVRHISPSTSPHTNSSSSSSHSVFCGHCDSNAVKRCLDCNDVFCADCVIEHKANPYTKNHTIVGLGKITPIGSVTSSSMLHSAFNNIHQATNNMHQAVKEPQCETHGEALRFLCETCKKIVCQECTMKDHKDHKQTPIANISADKAKEKLKSIHESSKTGIKFIKTSIDRAVAYSQSIERDSLEITTRVKKAFRLMVLAAEDRERMVLEQVEKYRQQKLANLSDQMTGLRSALAGLAETSECLAKSTDSITENTAKFEVALLLSNTENQLEKFASMYKNLQPKEETLSFVPPTFEIIQEIRNQGEIMISYRGNGNHQNHQQQNPNGNGSGGLAQAMPPAASMMMQRQNPRNMGGSPNNGDPQLWDSSADNSSPGSSGMSSHVTAAKTYASIVKPVTINNGNALGQCIPGSNSHISIKPALGPRLSFCFDGHEDGMVSRPWGICVNKNNEIIIADRRNNRIQVFYADGTFKTKFGSKGTGNGQFDLPAGVATDESNRIVVVDKDNHRVQVFSSTGVYILKFGSYGKELSQFMYPWACAINSKAQILVTDSRNHRIQLFSPDGHFISRFSFDGLNHSRYLKGLTTPRGVAFNPQGDIIISDFENHRLILIDGEMTKILATRGHEGTALNEFCRPSGICCDDDGRIIIADSKNQRVLVCSPMLEFLWNVEIRPSSHNILTSNMDEKDRPSDVALLNDGRLVVLVETSPDSREVISPHKTFVQVY